MRLNSKHNLLVRSRDFDVQDHLDRKEARKLDQFSQYAMVSSTEAMADSGLMESDPNCRPNWCNLGVGNWRIKNVSRRMHQILQTVMELHVLIHSLFRK